MKRKTRIINTLALLAMSLGTVPTANAALKAFSEARTYDNVNIVTVGGMPTWFQGIDNVAVVPCIDAACAVAPGTPALPNGTFLGGPVVFPSNYPDEAFYFSALTDPIIMNGTAGAVANIEVALEFLVLDPAGGPLSPLALVDLAGNLISPAPGGVGVFQRLRFDVDPLDCTTGGLFTIDHPWGTTVLNAAVDGTKKGTGCQVTQDIPAAILPNNFVAALGIPVPGPAEFSMSSFLKSNTAVPPFLGDAATSSTFTGGTVRQVFTITGPALFGTGTATRATITGKTLGLDVTPTTLDLGRATIAATPPATATKSVTITNFTSTPIVFGPLVPTAGANTTAAEFVISPPTAVGAPPTCDNATVLVGNKCSFNVTFAPVAPLAGQPRVAPRAATLVLNPTTTAVVPTPALPSPVTITLSGTAQFPLTVTVTNSGPLGNLGSGSVSSTPDGISNCTVAGGVNCTASFDAGSTVTMNATASTVPLSLLNNWGGGVCTGTAACAPTMTAAQTVTADFIKAWNLTITPTKATTTAGGTITPTTVVKDGATPDVLVDLVDPCNRVTAFTDNTTPATLTPLTALTSKYVPSPVVADRTLGVTFDNRQAVTVNAGANGTVTGGAAILTCGQPMPTFTVTPAAKFQVRTIQKDTVAQTFTPATNPLGGAVSFPFPAITTSSDTPLVLAASFMPSGDLNGDGTLGLADALKSLQIFVGTFNTDATDLAAMDVFPLGTDGKPAGDIKQDIGDVLTILKRAIGAVSW